MISRRLSPLLAGAVLAVTVMALRAESAIAATPPILVNYQGVLRDPATGTPMSGAYDAVFRFYSAATGGDEVLVDTHLAIANQGLSVADGLFSVPLGGGAVTDGSGPGSYAGLDAVFRDYGSVWLEIEIQGQLLSPRVSVISSPYALNATNLAGKPASSFLDTSSSDQTKTGPLTIYTGNLAYGVTAAGRGGGVRAYDSLGGAGLSEVGVGDFGIRSYGRWGSGGMPGWFKDTQGSGEAWLAPGNDGLISFGSNAGGIFRRGTPGSYTDEASLGFNGYGVFAKGDTAGGLFMDRQGTSEAWLGFGNNGIEGYGTNAGGLFRRGSPGAYTDEALLGYGGYGIYATGQSMGAEFRTAAPGLAYAKLAYNTFGYGYGIVAGGTSMGAEFFNLNAPASVRIAKDSGTGGGEGIQAFGSDYAGYFSRVAVPNSFSEVYLGNAWGVEAVSNIYYSPGAAVFYDLVSSSMVQLSRSDVGIVSYGGAAAGVFRHGTEAGWDNWANLADGSSAIVGSGAKNFVQNHPYDADSEIVYTSLEGDEVGTYTRGSAVFAHGVARVKLSPSFAWVTNPDIGLTATVTPRGVPVRLAVESVSSSELVVRAEPGAQDVHFDYVVQGLRAGFENASVVRPRRADAPIPPMAEHEEVYAAHPELRAHSALERFKAMPEEARGGKPVDLSRSEALVAAIGTGDMKTPPAKRRSLLTPAHAAQWEQVHPGESLAEWESRPSELRGRQKGLPSNPLDGSTPGRSPAELTTPSPDSGGHPAPSPIMPQPIPLSTTPRLPVAEAVEPGDVLVNDWARPGNFVRANEAGDRGVIGIVAGESGARFLSEAPVAMAGTVVLCKVDATEIPIEANDLLMASSLAGHAMRAGENPKQGTVIGKALEPLSAGTGVIKVLVMSR